jgi:hypothetical protein
MTYSTRLIVPAKLIHSCLTFLASSYQKNYSFSGAGVREGRGHGGLDLRLRRRDHNEGDLQTLNFFPSFTFAVQKPDFDPRLLKTRFKNRL